MTKKIFLFITMCVLTIFVKGQAVPFPQLQSLGSPTTLVYSRGALRADSGLILSLGYADTTAANSGHISTYPGGLIRTTSDLLFMRNNTASGWIGIQTQPAWDLSGNSGTNTTSNFLGTIDNISMVFRTNNTKQMILTNLGQLGIGTQTPMGLLQVNFTSSALQPTFQRSAAGDITGSFNSGIFEYNTLGTSITSYTGTGVPFIGSGLGVETNFGFLSSTNAEKVVAWVQGGLVDYANQLGSLNFGVNGNASTTQPSMVLNTQGHLGVGKNNIGNLPDSTLTVGGGVRLPLLYVSADPTDSMLVKHANGGVGYRAIPGGGSDSGCYVLPPTEILYGGVAQDTSTSNFTYDYQNGGILNVNNLDGGFAPINTLRFEAGLFALKNVSTAVNYVEIDPTNSFRIQDPTTGTSLWQQVFATGGISASVINGGTPFNSFEINGNNGGLTNTVNDGTNTLFAFKNTGYSGATFLDNQFGHALNISMSGATSLFSFNNSDLTIQQNDLGNSFMLGGDGAINTQSAGGKNFSIYADNDFVVNTAQAITLISNTSTNISNSDITEIPLTVTQAASGSNFSFTVGRAGFGTFTWIDNAGNMETNSYKQDVFNSSMVTTDGSGKLIAAVPGVDYAAPSTTPTIVSENCLSAQSAPATIATYTTGGADSSFTVSAQTTVTALSVNIVNTTVTYTDPTAGGTSRTLTFFPMGATSATLSVGASNYAVMGEIRVKGGTAITVAVTATGVGSETYDACSTITKLHN